MRETLLTRKDDNVGDGPFDSIAWAFSEHLKLKDLGNYQSAVLYGNEDSPDRIDFYLQAEPKVTDRPELIWRAEPRISCDQYQALMINGIFCHENGCPNQRKTWVKDRGWVQYVECFECGSDVELGESCDCQNPDLDSQYANANPDRFEQAVSDHWDAIEEYHQGKGTLHKQIG